ARTGEGQFVDASLCYTATFLQTPFLVTYPGKTWDEPRGQDQVGSGPLHRAYEAADGWFFLGTRDAAELAGVEGLDGVASLEGATLEAALAERFRAAGVAEWVWR